jgi:soluble lytic murein transglycosylase-like protein
MKDCRSFNMPFFARFSRVALLLGISVISAGSAAAQESSAGSSTSPRTVATSDPKSDLKSSLNALSSSYQGEVERLEKQHNISKDLYKDGLISRVDFENSEKMLVEARAKVEEVAKQIEAANRPAPMMTPDALTAFGVSNEAWTTGNSRIDSLIRYYGNQHNVDPYLIYCLMSQESRFIVSAISHKGAQGLMQLMPGTAARYGVTNPYDVAQNISGGTRYLKDLLKMFNGRVDLALAGYNAGEGAVMKYGYSVPPYSETRNYVRLILARYSKRQVS